MARGGFTETLLFFLAACRAGLLSLWDELTINSGKTAKTNVYQNRDGEHSRNRPPIPYETRL